RMAHGTTGGAAVCRGGRSPGANGLVAGGPGPRSGRMGGRTVFRAVAARSDPVRRLRPGGPDRLHRPRGPGDGSSGGKGVGGESSEEAVGQGEIKRGAPRWEAP